VFENRTLRRTVRPEREKEIGDGGNCIVRNFVVATHHQTLFGDKIKNNGGWTEHVARMEDRSREYRVLVAKRERKKETTWKFCV
jgi:hypothetical protein